MADQNGTTLPPIPSTPAANQTGSSQDSSTDINIVMGPSSKDVMIGAGALLVLAIVFFFVRNAFVHWLIGPSMKRSPNSAGMAGWGLFGGLFFGAALGCAAIISKSFMTMPLIIALLILSTICFVITLVVALKK
jgi:fatty acid desaturase